MWEKQKALFASIASNPTVLWVTVFVIAGIVAASVSGFLRVRRIQPNRFKWKQVRTEVIIIAIGALTSGFFLGGLTKFLNGHGWITYNNAPAAWWVILLEFAVYFVLFDTWFYWFHRLMHKEPIYRLVHKWHHYSTAPTLLTTISVSPLESLINGGFLPLFTAAVTLHKESMMFIGPTAALMGFYLHSGYEFLPRWWNKSWATKWFITATFHDQHHKYFSYNYGGYTTLWDRLCGTMRKKYEDDFANPKARRLYDEEKRAKLAGVTGSSEIPAAMDAPA